MAKKLIGGYRIMKDGPYKARGSESVGKKEPTSPKTIARAPVLPKTTSSLSLPKNKK